LIGIRFDQDVLANPTKALTREKEKKGKGRTVREKVRNFSNE
jgi:hypothetical protein